MLRFDWEGEAKKVKCLALFCWLSLMCGFPTERHRSALE